MPGLLDILLDPLTLSILALYLTLILWEALFPARKLPPIKYWQIKGLAAFVVFFLLSTYLPIMYADLLPAAQLIDLTDTNPVIGATVGVLLYELGMYVWHLSMHRSNLLWRVFHQMHHSAERLDTYGAFYFSPFDMIGWTLLGTVCFSFVLGVPAEAITYILLITNFFSIFQHANIRTPQWLGYFIQRPESHAYHHARGLHKNNYSDLPLFDIIFGTFSNPKTYPMSAGFYDGASSRVKDMLLFRDVSENENSTIPEIIRQSKTTSAEMNQ